jgi:hypothetical protein
MLQNVSQKKHQMATRFVCALLESLYTLVLATLNVTHSECSNHNIKLP